MGLLISASEEDTAREMQGMRVGGAIISDLEFSQVSAYYYLC